jgi:hypothetical protein
LNPSSKLTLMLKKKRGVSGSRKRGRASPHRPARRHRFVRIDLDFEQILSARVTACADPQDNGRATASKVRASQMPNSCFRIPKFQLPNS